MRTTFTGLRAWLVQRLTAVYMLLSIVGFLLHFVVGAPHSYPGWRDWMMTPSVRIATTVFFAALLAHAWVGLRDVILDYIHPLALRVCLFVLVSVGATVIGIWAFRILWMQHGSAI
jgi:succinate dehydrogenase membrane anchor subunit